MRVVFFLSNIIELREEWHNKAKPHFFSLPLTNILLIPNENYWIQSDDPNTCSRVHLFRIVSFLVFFIHLLHCSLAVKSSLLLPGMYLANKYNLCDWCVFRKLRELKQTLILVHRAQLNPNRGNVHNWILWSFHFTQSKYETDFLKDYTISVHICPYYNKNHC